MEKRIELERRGRKPNTITELNLDNCRSTSIVGLTDEYAALQSLSLINVGLTTLKGFPKLPNLKKLELSDNRISNGLNLLHTSPKLQYLNLSGNKIKDLDTLKPLKEFQHLAVLDLFNNETTQMENYREKIFEMLPSLKFLDGFDCNDVEGPSEGDDEEENGNYSEDDDKRTAFCLNGLEIDLDEFEAFEKHINSKRSRNMLNKNASNTITESTIYQRHDLDEFLEKLQLNENENCDDDDKEVEKAIMRNDNCEENVQPPSTSTSMNYALLLYWFLAILNMMNAAIYSESDNTGDDEDGGGSDDFSEDEDNGDVSLSEVYNDDLEEDEDEWDEGNAEGEDDDDADSDIDELNESGAVATGAAAAAPPPPHGTKKKEASANNVNNAEEEPQARGKKRKLEG